MNATAFHLTWDPPFTLDITDVDPDISGYVLYIRNTYTGSITVVNTIDPVYTLEISIPNCDTYAHEVSVAAILNGGREGEATTPIIVNVTPLVAMQPSGCTGKLYSWCVINLL